MTLIVATLAAAAVPVIVWLAKEIYQFYRRRQRTLLFPGPPVKFWTGNLHQIPRDLTERLTFIRGLVAQYPYGCHLLIGPDRAQVFLHHPDTIRELLNSNAPKVVTQGGAYQVVKRWLGTRGLLVGNGSHWFRNRRLLTPAFHFGILKSYAEVYNACADILIDKWLSKLSAAPDVSINVSPDLSLCTLDVIMRCAFSYDKDVQLTDETKPYAEANYKLKTLAMKRMSQPLYRRDFIYNFTSDGKEFNKLADFVHTLADDVIASRKKALSSNKQDTSKRRYTDFLDTLLLARDDEGQGLDDVEIREEVDTFLFAGHDTTSTAVGWVLYALANHPEIQDKVRAELNCLGTEDHITWDNLAEVPYMTMCIKEAMRLHGVVPFSSRILEQPLTVRGVELLPGTIITVCLDNLHHNPLVWGEDHMEYDPQRFSSVNSTKMDSHAFCPFSAGPRNCIGQHFAMHEIKTIVARIVKRFQLVINVEDPIPIKRATVIMESVNGIHIKMTPIQNLSENATDF